MKRVFLVCALCWLGSSASAAAPPSRLSDPKTVVIFADVTSSLSVMQNRHVAELTKQVIFHLPPLTTYGIYLIQADSDEAPIARGTIRSARNSEDAVRRRQELQAEVGEIVGQIERRYCEINASRGESVCKDKKCQPRPQPDQRSCILNVVENVARTFLREEQRRPIDLVFISDMVEDCADTPLNGSIRLIKDDLSSDILNIDRFRSLQPIPSDVRITVVRPHVTNGAIESSARKRSLEDYWKKAFGRFGIVIDIKRWWFESDLPARFSEDLATRNSRN
jgi:hypothetical protein